MLRLRESGRTPEAQALCDAVRRSHPHHPEASHYKGIFVAEDAGWRQALPYFRKAARGQPGDPRYLVSLAVCLWALGRTVDAIAAAEQGLGMYPRDAELLVHWAKLLAENDDARALPAIKRAIPLASDPAPLLVRAAGIAEENGNFGESADFWHELLKLCPRDEVALNNLARIRSAQGRIADALALYRRAIKLPGSSATVGSNLLLTLLYDERAAPIRIFAEHRAWAARIAEPPPRRSQVHAPRRKKLRVGYVSGDFRLHAVAYFAESVLQRHDRNRIELHCFSNSPHHDRVTARFRRFAAGWHQIDEMSDDRALECIRRAKIDILVDMSGHSANNRLTMFARRPAPIQVNYLGYQATSGLRAIDYRFTDSLADPPGETEHLHSETLVRLDPCFQCYRPLLAQVPVDPPPFKTRGYVTLACYAIRQKFSPPLLEAWAEILRRSDGTRLILKCYSLSDSAVRRELAQFFERRGVSEKRLEFQSWTPTMRAHLASYRQADMMLDTYPYNSATMTCEALWRGVPTVTWAGPTFVSRMGVSLLSQVGLEDLVAFSASEYVEKAVVAVADPTRLAAWRHRMRRVMRASPLMDAPRLARQIEDAYFNMWRA